MDLESERLRLVSATRERCEAELRVNRPPIKSGSGQVPWRPSTLVTDFTANMLRHVGDDGMLTRTGWFIFDRSWPEPHGGLVLMDELRSGGVAKIGWAVGPAAEGLGYASEATRVVVEWALREKGLSKITTRISADNQASVAVAQRVGFVYAGRAPSKEGQVVGSWEFTRSSLS